PSFAAGGTRSRGLPLHFFWQTEPALPEGCYKLLRPFPPGSAGVLPAFPTLPSPACGEGRVGAARRPRSQEGVGDRLLRPCPQRRHLPPPIKKRGSKPWPSRSAIIFPKQSFA